jgi:hypothetical protein
MYIVCLGHDSKDYRPAFLDHFEKTDRQPDNSRSSGPDNKSDQAPAAPKTSSQQPQAANQALQRQLEQIAGGQPVGGGPATPAAGPSNNGGNAAESNAAKFQKSLLDGDLEFVSFSKYRMPQNFKYNLPFCLRSLSTCRTTS